MGKARGQKPTHHSLMRMAERCGITNRTAATNMIRRASKMGRHIQSFPDGELKNYLLSKQHNKRVRVYKGIVFIFNKTSDRAITLYPIPNEFMEEYKTYDK